MSARNVLPLLENWGAPRVARGKALSPSARPYLASAFRIPERMTSQLAIEFPGASPQIFVHEGARQALERRLVGAFPGPVILSITDNRHSIITHRLKDGILRIRIHHMFLDAPPNVVEALVRYVVHNEREASASVGQFIEANGARLNKRPRSLHLTTKGKHHDLLSIFQRINASYFSGRLNSVITWGKRPTRRTRIRTTIKLGSYSAAERLIRIHPVLDRSWVPRYFVAAIVYHEMLHHVIPAVRVGDKLVLHPPEFRELESLFHDHARALEWENNHIARLLRS